MKILRTLLVDDERVGRSRLRRMLEKETDIEIIGECGDGAAALEMTRSQKPDLLFLDINMPGMDGFEVLDALGPENQPPAVVFVTAYDEHAVRAFEVCALDYLLKPASAERLSQALERARGLIANAPRLAAETSAAAPPLSPQNPKRYILRSGGRIVFLAPEEVDWVEAAGNYAIMHAGKQNHMLRETMSAMEAQLSAHAFLRVSRSALVNLRRVKELCASPVNDHAAILHDGQRIAVTRNLREAAGHLAALLPPVS